MVEFRSISGIERSMFRAILAAYPALTTTGALANRPYMRKNAFKC